MEVLTSNLRAVWETWTDPGVYPSGAGGGPLSSYRYVAEVLGKVKIEIAEDDYDDADEDDLTEKLIDLADEVAKEDVPEVEQIKWDITPSDWYDRLMAVVILEVTDFEQKEAINSSLQRSRLVFGMNSAELEFLIDEAKKYESADDFVNSERVLVRGSSGRTAENSLGLEGGIWATDNATLARTFGTTLEVLPMPEKILNCDAFALANMVGEDDFTELTSNDWSNIKIKLIGEGYNAVNLGPGHMDAANDFWILDENYPRFQLATIWKAANPTLLTKSNCNSKLIFGAGPEAPQVPPAEVALPAIGIGAEIQLPSQFTPDMLDIIGTNVTDPNDLTYIQQNLPGAGGVVTGMDATEGSDTLGMYSMNFEDPELNRILENMMWGRKTLTPITPTPITPTKLPA